jgi:hypothetical protein
MTANRRGLVGLGNPREIRQLRFHQLATHLSLFGTRNRQLAKRARDQTEYIIPKITGLRIYYGYGRLTVLLRRREFQIPETILDFPFCELIGL